MPNTVSTLHNLGVALDLSAYTTPGLRSIVVYRPCTRGQMPMRYLPIALLAMLFCGPATAHEQELDAPKMKGVTGFVYRLYGIEHL
jgi:hypothetical protein